MMLLYKLFARSRARKISTEPLQTPFAITDSGRCSNAGAIDLCVNEHESNEERCRKRCETPIRRRHVCENNGDEHAQDHHDANEAQRADGAKSHIAAGDIACMNFSAFRV